MANDALSFTALVSTSTLFVLVHFSILRRVFVTRLPLGVRLLALVPPVAPVLAWVVGHRAVALLWAALVATYVALSVVL